MTADAGAGTSAEALGSEPIVVNSDLAGASDAALAVGVARWRPEALAEAYRRNAGVVLGLAKRLLVEEALAEEVTQEVFMGFWQRPELYDPARGSLRAFLLAVAHGRAVDLLRSETSRRAREQRARAVAGAGYDLEQEVVELVANERVREALDRLPEGERSAIELAYFGGHTYREVATIQNEPEGTVKSRIRSGLRRMETELAHLAEGTNQ
jgi:RNA polymerase sigma-70 factor (ECF subfamily)